MNPNHRIAALAAMLASACLLGPGCSTGLENTGVPGAQNVPGEQGATGAQGATGPQGPAGPQGPPGASPFALVGNDAVLNGTVFADAFSSNSPLRLQTAGTTRAFIDDATGAMGLGTESPQANLHIRDTQATALLETINHSSGSKLILRGNSSILGQVEFQNSGGATQATLQYSSTTNALGLQTGNATFLMFGSSGRYGFNRLPSANTIEVEGAASKSTAGNWLSNSDAAIKTDVETLSQALDALDRVRLVKFRYTDEYRAVHPCIEDRTYVNVIAQEYREVFPEYVQSSGERIADGREILQVDPYPLTIYSAAAVQELHRKVKQKDGEIAELRARNEAHERWIEQLETRLNRLEEALGPTGAASGK